MLLLSSNATCHRYAPDASKTDEELTAMAKDWTIVGLVYKLNSVDPWLKAPGFNP